MQYRCKSAMLASTAHGWRLPYRYYLGSLAVRSNERIEIYAAQNLRLTFAATADGKQVAASGSIILRDKQSVTATI